MFYIICFISMVLGLIAGFIVGVLLFTESLTNGKLTPSQPKSTQQKNDKKKAKKIRKTKEPSKGIPTEPANVLKERLPEKDDSWMALNCAADGQDTQTHLLRQRAKQDEAYNQLRGKKFKKNNVEKP